MYTRDEVRDDQLVSLLAVLCYARDWDVHRIMWSLSKSTCLDLTCLGLFSVLKPTLSLPPPPTSSCLAGTEDGEVEYINHWNYQHNYIYGWNCPGRIFFQKNVTFFATLTAVFKHFLHWFDCFNYFYGSITCATVGKTKFLTRHLRLGTWKKPLNMDDFEVFSHLFPFCISSYKP